ncbi:MAG: alpha-amylase/4-alpha-glucanotransferase domain-containing protein, partial [Termitinemataceae bacterium]
SVFELDHIPSSYNYVDTFVSAPTTGEYLSSRLRPAVIEYLCPPGIGFQDAISEHSTMIRRCSREMFKEVTFSRSQQSVGFILEADPSKPFGPISVTKTFSLKKHTLTVSYALVNTGNFPLRFSFITQIDFSFSGFSNDNYRLFIQREQDTEEVDLDELNLRSVDAIQYLDSKNDTLITISLKLPFSAWQYPVFEKNSQYQSTCIMPIQEVLLASQEKWETYLTLTFERPAKM